MKKLRKITKPILYFIYNLVGTRHLLENIIWPTKKDTKKSKPSTFIFWLMGIYVALFSIASQRYENRVDLIEIRISSVITQLSTPHYKNAFPSIAEIQQLSCPLKPDIKNPITVFQSLFTDTIYSEGVDLLKNIVENWRDSLSLAELHSVDLSNTYLLLANLENAELSNSKLNNAYLCEANLSYAYFEEADLNHANLIRANLSYADLGYADLSYVNLSYADLKNADLLGVNLMGVYLERTDFMNSSNLRKEQLSKSFYTDNPPINLPDGIDPPPQFEVWKKLYKGSLEIPIPFDGTVTFMEMKYDTLKNKQFQSEKK